jgi:hypothetical protein
MVVMVVVPPEVVGPDVVVVVVPTLHRTIVAVAMAVVMMMSAVPIGVLDLLNSIFRRRHGFHRRLRTTRRILQREACVSFCTPFSCSLPSAVTRNMRTDLNRL